MNQPQDLGLGGNSGAEIDTERPSRATNFRSAYVFLRTPKKLGDKLHPDDVDPPEGWGIYLEEGFRVHHLLIVMLFVYVLSSLAFGIFWYRKYGMMSPQSGLEAFGVSSWMISLMTMLMTVWFKWTD